MQRRIHWWAGIVLASLVASCTPIPPSDGSLQIEPITAKGICDDTRQPEVVKTKALWVEGHVIVVGTQQDLDAAVKRLAGDVDETVREATLLPVETCSLAQLAESKLFDQALQTVTGIALQSAERGQLVMRRYKLSGVPVEKVVLALNRYHDRELMHGKPLFIFAHPNYLVGPSGGSNCANPHTIGDAPHTIGDAPHTIGDAPLPGPGMITQTAEAGQFMSQWALDDFTSGMLTQTQAVGHSGQGVTVVIFDTSPFTSVPENHMAAAPILWAQPATFTLSLWHPILPSVMTPGGNVPEHANEHGLFVAGLVHAMAPQSKIELIRVLDDAGCGEIETLGTELLNFLLRTGEVDAPLDNVVINLSLGVHAPLGAGEIFEEILWLALPVEYARLRNATIVAAAGNDSGELAIPKPSLRPGGYHTVISVAASVADGRRTCYSNKGKVSAPSGNGGGFVEPADTGNARRYACAPLAKRCAGQGGQCEYGVIGLVRRPDASPTGYAYWSGTSFATPLVTGLAALVIGRGRAPAPSEEEVRTLIFANAVPTAPTLGARESNAACTLLPERDKPAACPSHALTKWLRIYGHRVLGPLPRQPQRPHSE